MIKFIVSVLLVMACGLVHATTIFYIPYAFDEGGEDVTVTYLTNEHNKLCQPPFMIARTEMLTDPSFKPSLMCWTFRNDEIWALLKNGNQYLMNAQRIGIVPGAEKEAQAYIQKIEAANKTKLQRSIENANKPR